VRKLMSLVAIAAASVTVTALAAAPALADPPASHGKTIVPRNYDVVGVGSDTDDFLVDQLAADYDAAHKKVHNKSHPWIYSWDAVPPKNPNNLTSTIVTKQGCKSVARPDGSGLGLTAFEANVKTRGYDCIDFAREASYRSSDPLNKTPNGDLYVRLAEDAETYAVNSTTDAPANLTPSQLHDIFSCTDAKWSDVGGADAPIVVALPASTTGVTKFWLKALGISSFPTCATVVQQNEGTASVFANATTAPEVIAPYSVGKYIAQVHHDAKCGRKPTKSQNAFGCDEHGTLKLGALNLGTGGIQQATVGTGTKTKINTKLGETFLRPLYDLVWYATKSTNGDHIPNRLEPFFASATSKVKGWFCANKEAQQAIVNYGFLTTKLCGFGS